MSGTGIDRKRSLFGAMLLLLTRSFATPAAAQYNNPPSPDVQGKFVPAEPATLPFTGADLTMFVMAGVGAVVIGSIIWRRFRRSRV